MKDRNRLVQAGWAVNPASVPENVAFINRYLQAGSPAPGAAATAPATSRKPSQRRRT